MAKVSRRGFITSGLIGGLAVTWPLMARAGYLPNLIPTPSEVKGPFYPIIAQKDKDFDLTIVEGRPGVAKGPVIMVEGKVCDTDGSPVSDASVEIWQANGVGRYNHPHDPNTAPLDPNFQGWAIVPSGSGGGFRFKTIFPGSYPASQDWTRPPHIHFKVAKRGFIELITQMYFPGQPLNKKDLLFRRKGPEEQKLMIAEKTPIGEIYRFNIVLQQA